MRSLKRENWGLERNGTSIGELGMRLGRIFIESRQIRIDVVPWLRRTNPDAAGGFETAWIIQAAHFDREHRRIRGTFSEKRRAAFFAKISYNGIAAL